MPYLAESQRRHTRPYYLKAQAGMTGANFAIAETGSFVVCTNEGNADLGANLPKLHIASIGIEKLLPKIEHLGVFVRMLSRSALGSPITQITSHFRAPRPGTEMHVVLVDNGRSERLGMEDFWYSLKCIRCGACMNTCPVYRRSGGLSYGSTYSGPIGVIIDPTFNLRKYSSLPFASTLNGSCTSVCPVKINIHEQIYKWRQVIAERHQLPMVKKEAMRVAGKILASPRDLSRRGRGRGRRHREAAALHRLQPVQRLGPAARGAVGAAVDLPPVVPEEPREARVSSRELILGRVRRNQPAWRELPAGAGLRAAARRSAGGVRRGARAHGRNARRSAGDGDVARRFMRARFPDARVICSATPEVEGHAARRTPCATPRELDDVDVGVVRAVFGVAETGLGVAERARVRRQRARLPVAAPGRPARPARRSSPTCTTPTGMRGFREARYAVLMTGPSATADIEGVLIRGAQGIRTLTVIPVAAQSAATATTQRRTT